MLISCSFNSFRIFGHYISARFQIIWRPNLWLVSCTALIFFLEFIILQISLSFFLYCCHLPLHHTIITIIKRAPDLSSAAFPSFIHSCFCSCMDMCCLHLIISLSSSHSIRDSLHPFPPLRLKFSLPLTLHSHYLPVMVQHQSQSLKNNI